jgi:hypothetical protein
VLGFSLVNAIWDECSLLSSMIEVVVLVKDEVELDKREGGEETLPNKSDNNDLRGVVGLG